MTAPYRIVHYDLNPFTGNRFALGGLVMRDGKVHAVKARLPDHIRDPVAAAAVLIQQHMGSGTFDELPGACGPSVSLGDVRRAPTGSDPVEWLRLMFRGIDACASLRPV